MTTLTVLVGSEENVVLNVRDADGKTIDFSTATRWVAVHYGTTFNFTVDTDIDAGSIVGDADGNVTFAYQGITPLDGVHVVSLKVYDPAHPNGQVIADECCGPYLCMKICGGASAPSATTGAYFEAEVIADDGFSPEGPGTFVIGVYNTGTGPTLSASLGTASWVGFYGLAQGSDDDMDFIENGVDVTATLSQTGVQLGAVLKVAVRGTNLWLGQFIGGVNVWYDSTGGTTGDPAAGTNPTMTVPAQTWLAFAGTSVEGS